MRYCSVDIKAGHSDVNLNGKEQPCYLLSDAIAFDAAKQSSPKLDFLEWLALLYFEVSFSI